MISFYVPGKPQSQRIALAAHTAMNGSPLITGAVAMSLTFDMYQPASYTPWATKKPDLDKCIRAVFDALTGVCFNDDAQVVYVSARKQIAEPGRGMGVLIQVTEMPAQ